MIDDKGVKQPVYLTHKRFLEQARNYVKERLKKTGRLPGEDEYRRAAVRILDGIAKEQ
jgi:hypothetical protein